MRCQIPQMINMFPRLLIVALAFATVIGHTAGGDHGLWMHYDSVFSFGDSLTDTGNDAILPATAGGASTRPPYGKTYFHHPTGRWSDGRLIIDFIVEALRMPEPTRYLAGKAAADFRHGVNFAFSGATALDPAFLERKGVTSTFVPVSLSNETIWFNDTLQLLAGSSPQEKRKVVASSMFYFGEIGVNDYFLALLCSNGTIDLTKGLVPHIISVVRSALTAVISAGARTVVVTGMIPIGCEPQLLATFPGGADEYDRANGCMTRFNELAELHNRELNLMLGKLRRANSAVSVIYADIYNPIADAVASPAKYGFGDRPLTAYCSGGGGPDHIDNTTSCGMPGFSECSGPSSEFISWDGIHYTEAANRFIADATLRQLYKLMYRQKLTDITQHIESCVAKEEIESK